MPKVFQREASAGRSPGFFLLLSCAWLIMDPAIVPLFAQESRLVRSITIVGNALVPAPTIQAWVETKPGMAFVPADVDLIASRYALEGFPFAKVDSVVLVPSHDSSVVDLTLWIHEGKPARVSSIRCEGMKAVTESNAMSVMKTQVGGRFVPQILERDIVSVLSLYENTGFPFAKISVSDLGFVERADSVEASILLKVDEGPLALIRRLRVEGNTITSTGLILRQARLADGELFHADEPARIKRRIEQLQLFSRVSMPELFVEKDGSVGLLVKVAEGNPNQFDGVVGYIPSSSSGGGGYFTGLLDLQFRNILGSGRRLAARWYRENVSSEEIELRYGEPWVASLPVNIEAGFAQRKQDSTYVRNSYTVSAELMATDELNLGLVFSAERVLPSEGYGARVTSESRTTSIGVSVSYDSRDDPVTPTKGFSYKTEYLTGVKEIEGPLLPTTNDRTSTQRFTFDLEYFIPIEKQVFAASLHARDYRNEEVELSDLYRLGGTNTLRGYREGQFLGSRVAWSNLEYRYLTGSRSFAFGFIDLGYSLTPDRPQTGLVREELRRLGYGIGVRLDTSLGLMGVSLAFGQGDSFSTAKLHFRLVNEF